MAHSTYFSNGKVRGWIFDTTYVPPFNRDYLLHRFFPTAGQIGEIENAIQAKYVQTMLREYKWQFENNRSRPDLYDTVLLRKQFHPGKVIKMQEKYLGNLRSFSRLYLGFYNAAGERNILVELVDIKTTDKKPNGLNNDFYICFDEGCKHHMLLEYNLETQKLSSFGWADR